MKKTYISPSIVVEASVLPAIMDTLSVFKTDFGDGTGDVGGSFIINAKYDGFGTFDDFDDEDD